MDHIPTPTPVPVPTLTFARRLLALVAVVALAGTAAACSDDGGDQLADTESIDSSSPEPGAGDGGDGEDEAADAGDDAPDGEVLGSAQGNLRSEPGVGTLVPLRVDVLGLERQGELVELRFELFNEGEAGSLNFEPWVELADPMTANYDVSGVALVDGEEQKLYLPVLDSEGVCLCSVNLAEPAVEPGGSILLNATYGGVPDGVERLDVRVPGFSAIEGVPLS